MVQVVNGQTSWKTIASWLVEDRPSSSEEKEGLARFNRQSHCLFWLGLADVTSMSPGPKYSIEWQGFDETLALCITNILPLPAITQTLYTAHLSQKCISLRL